MKPRVLTKCVANHYAASNERIVEFSFPGTKDHEQKGGLVSFRRLSDGTTIVNLYGLDDDVKVVVDPKHLPSVRK